MNREKKTVEICVRVTPAEKKELQEKADAAQNLRQTVKCSRPKT